MITAASAGLGLDVPVDPDAPVASDWLATELAKPQYQAAQPTLFDRIAKAIADWLASLRVGEVHGAPAFGLIVILLVIVAVIVVAFLIFGLPRFNRRSKVRGSLFGDDDDRDSARIRRDAESSARRGEFTIAIVEMFRAIARGLAERTIVMTMPGTTARDFATRAGAVFNDHADELARAAVVFDLVRYLGRVGTADQYEQVAKLERELRALRPAHDLVDA
jgi:hypothetical protein